MHKSRLLGMKWPLVLFRKSGLAGAESISPPFGHLSLSLFILISPRILMAESKNGGIGGGGREEKREREREREREGERQRGLCIPPSLLLRTSIFQFEIWHSDKGSARARLFASEWSTSVMTRVRMGLSSEQGRAGGGEETCLASSSSSSLVQVFSPDFTLRGKIRGETTLNKGYTPWHKG